MIMRLQMGDFHKRNAAREAWLDNEIQLLRRDVAGEGGCPSADVSLKQWAPTCI